MKIIRRLALASLVLVQWLPIRAQESASKPAATPRNITIDDYFQIREVSQPEISPDGQSVAYAVLTRMLKEDKNEQRLWMVSTHGGDPIPLTAEGVSSSHLRWSPDGKYLAFLSARNNGKTQVWLLNRLGGEAAHLTDVPQGVDDFEWSPDSTRLVLILRDPKPEELEAAKDKDKDKPAAAAKPKTPPPFVIDRLQFKRDTVGYLDRRRAHLYVFDVVSKKSTQVTSGDFDDSEPTWSPDGKSLAFASNRSTPDPDATYNSDIWVVAANNTDKGAHLTQITTNPGPDRSPAWSPDGKWIAFISEIDMKAMIYATHHLAMAPSSGGEAKVLTLAFDRSIRRPRFSADGRSIYFIADDDGTENLCRIGVTGGEVTHPIGGRLVVASYSLSKDGAIAAQISTLDRPDEIFLSNEKDLTRLTKTNDALFSQLRLAHPDKLGVGGWSYGGMSTDFIIAQTTRFKAAISGAGIALMTSGYGHDQYIRDYDSELGRPWENKTVWEKISPYYRVNNITTPTLFMGGDVDWNVPIIGGEQMYQALKSLGRTTELVVYPGEFHGFTTPSHIKDRLERYLAWYAHYVKGDSTPPRPAEPPTPGTKPAD